MPVANIATLLAFWVLPLTVWININNGHDMRRTFCGRDGADEWKAHTLYILPEGVFWVGLISVLTEIDFCRSVQASTVVERRVLGVAI